MNVGTGVGKQNEDNYEDIINMPHHVSSTHPQMPEADRAAQFAPFAALTGLGAAIGETARLAQDRREADEHGDPFWDEINYDDL